MHLHLAETELNVVYLDTFFDAYLRLDDAPETFRAMVNLLDEAITGGEKMPPLRTSKMRVVRTPVGSCSRPMRLFFSIEYGTLRFVHIEHYDENHP